MSKYHLSVLIPARNEYYYDIDLLNETVTNVLANTSSKTECVVILDGYTDSWPKSPLPVNDRLTVIHHRTSIGQRAATNEAARVAQGEYVMKLDAHCALDERFDEKLLADFQPLWTVVPGQYNLLAFTWKCKRCGTEKDQGPKPVKCGSCNSKYFKQVKVWKPRDGREGRRTAYTHSWRFDTNLDFQYWGAYTSDEKYCKKHNVPFRPEAQGMIHDTMSLLGACWAMRRDRYFYLEPCDEQMGSWGDMGSEISCKTWLSGGELKVNRNTWFAHFFRVGGIGFPYEGGGRKERAKARGKELWLKNQWPKQVYPLSWLIDKFKPLPDWHSGNSPVLDQVTEAGKAFSGSVASLVDIPAFTAVPDRPTSRGGGNTTKLMPSQTMGFRAINNGDGSGITTDVIPVIGYEGNVKRVTAGGIVADDVIKNRDTPTSSTGDRLYQPSVHVPMSQLDVSHVGISDMSVPLSITGASPDPTIQRAAPNDLGKHAGNLSSGGSLDNQHTLSHGLTITNKPSIGYLYYTCNSHDELLESAARANLLRVKNGNEIGCVALKRTDFGDWSIVLDREKSGATMHYQILAGLERMQSEFVFLCESDVFYHGSHFDFRPLSASVFFYNTNVWRVRWEDGHAVRTDGLQQVSGICASRRLLLEHYRRRIGIIEQANGRFDVKSMAYEPGTRGKFGDEKVANWSSPFPNLDITGHGQTLTKPKFSVDEFRNKRYSQGWQETDDPLPGWPKIAGRVQEWLREMVDG